MAEEYKMNKFHTPFFKIIHENFHANELVTNMSFMAHLHELAEINENEYWKIEQALYALKNDIDKNLYWMIFKIFSYTMLALSCHYDKNDKFKIQNISEDELYEFRERFQLIFEGFFSGLMPDLSIFNKKNPLITLDL